MCSVSTECFISFLLLPSALAMLHSLVKRKKEHRLLSQTELGLNSRSSLKNPIRLALLYSCYRQRYRSPGRLCDLHCGCACCIWHALKYISMCSQYKIEWSCLPIGPRLISLYWVICGQGSIPTKDPRGSYICQNRTMVVSGIPQSPIVAFAF